MEKDKENLPKSVLTEAVELLKVLECEILKNLEVTRSCKCGWHGLRGDAIVKELPGDNVFGFALACPKCGDDLELRNKIFYISPNEKLEISKLS